MENNALKSDLLRINKHVRRFGARDMMLWVEESVSKHSRIIKDKWVVSNH